MTVEKFTALVGANIKDFVSKMKRVDATMKKTATGADVNVGANIRGFIAKMATVRAQTNALKSKSAEINVTADTSRFTRSLAMLKAKMLALSNSNFAIKVWMKGEGVKDFFSNIKKNYQEGQAMMGRIATSMRNFGELVGTSLKGAFMAVLPAIAPILANVGALIGNLGVMVGVLAGQMAGFAFAAGTAFAGFGAATAMAVGNIKQLYEKGAKLNALQKQTKASIDSIKTTYNNLLTATQKPILQGVQKGANVANSLLKQLTPLFKSSANAFNSLMTTLQKSMGTPPVQQFIQYLNKEGAPMLITFGKSVGNIFKGLGSMFVAFAPLSKSVSQGFLGMTESFTKWAQGLQQSEKFKTFISYVQTNMPKISSIFGDLVMGLVAFFSSFSEQASGFMTGLQDMMKRFREWSEGLKSNDGFQKFLTYVKDTAPSVLSLIGNLTTFLVNLGVGMAPLGAKLLELVNGFLSWTNSLMQNNPIIGQIIAVVVSLTGAVIALLPWVLSFYKTFSSLLPPLGSFLGFIIRLVPKIISFGSTILSVASKALPWLVRGFTLLTGPVGIAIAIITTLISIGVALYKNWDTVKEKASQLGKWLSSIWSSIKQKTSELWNSTKEAISKAINSAKDAVSKAATATKEKAVSMYNSMKTSVVNAATTLRDKVKNAWESAKTAVTNAVNSTKEKAVNAYNKIKTSVVNAANSTKEKLQSAWSNAKTAVVNAVNTTKTKAINGFNNLRNSVTAAANSTKDKIKNAWDKAKSLVVNTVTAIKDKVSEKFNSLRDKVQEIMGKVKSTIEDKWNEAKSFLEGIDLTSIGKDIINGLINGITSKVGEVASAAKKVASAAKDAITGFLGIHSPSRVTTELGKWTGQGFANGISKKQKAAASAAKKVANAAKTAFNNAVQKLDLKLSAGTISTASYVKQMKAVGDKYKSVTNAQEKVNAKVAKATTASAVKAQQAKNKKVAAQTKAFNTKLAKLDNKYNASSKSASASKTYINNVKSLAKQYKANETIQNKANAKINTANKNIAKTQLNLNKQTVSKMLSNDKILTSKQLKSIKDISKQYAKGSSERIYFENQYDKAVKQNAKIQLANDKTKVSALVSSDKKLTANQLASIKKIANSYAKGSKERLHFEKQYAEAVKKNNKIVFEANKEKVEAIINNEKLSAVEQIKQIEKVTKSYKKGTEERAYFDEQLGKQKKALYDSLISANEKYTTAIQEANQKLIESEKQLNDEYAKSVASRADALSSFTSLFSEVTKTADVTSAQLSANLRDQVATLKDWASNIDSLASKGVTGSLLDELRELGPNASSEIAALNTMSESELAEYVSLWEEKSAFATSVATKELENLRKETDAQIEQLRAETATQLATYNAEWQAEILSLTGKTTDTFNALTASMPAIGKNVIKGMQQGLSSMTPALLAQAQSIANAIKSTIQSALDIHSPSRWGDKFIGRNLVLGIANGIDRMKKYAVQSASDLAESVKSELATNLQPITGLNTASEMQASLDKELTVKVKVDVDSNSATGGNVVINNQYDASNLTPSEVARQQKKQMQSLGLQF